MKTPKQFNNITSRVVDDLHLSLRSGSKISIAAASFSIYAYEALKNELESIEELRFIFTSPTFNSDKTKKEKREFYIPKLNRERNLFGSDYEIRLRNQLTQKAIARECADWIRRKVKFKSNISSGSMNSFLNVADQEETFTYMPFNEFTTTELGLDRGDNLCPMIVGLPSTPETDMFLKNFNELWRDSDKFADVTESVIENIENVYKENSADFIYFITLYNIFNEFLEDISEDVLPNEGTGFRNSQIWGKLFNFQRDAALAIINKLEKYNGCILADSVGLGKTYTALAVIKYYENRNKSVLVLCPKKLNENWTTYRSNYKNNPIAGDRLRYDILFHTDLSRETGFSNGLNLQNINWGNYDLVVIDESHNFRNGGRFTADEDEDLKENRYAKLMNRVIRAGVKTKVLMLSATPVNNRFVDLQNQLQLAYEGNTENIDSLLDTNKGINSIFAEASKAYAAWTRLEPEQRTTEKLLDSLSFDFFQMLDAVTIARSRSHIVKYYDTKDIGKFPQRLAPISRRPKLTDIADAINFKDISDELNNLNLSIYTPSYYILESRKEAYETKKNNRGVTLDGREMGMRKLMAINLLKRLESSVNSFRLTLSRIRDFVDDTVKAIERFENNRTANSVIDVEDLAYDFDSDDAEMDNLIGKKYKIALQDMDYVTWKRHLKADLEILDLLLIMLKDITPEHDTKLQLLYDDLKHKFENNINEGNKKVLVFTAFADTANYLYDQLASRILKDCGLHVALITGSGDCKTTIPKFQNDFNNVLTFFSPRSKDRDALVPNAKYEIDVLIATDCISEGQNLQDCDYLINYDIHWNPVRIIQRFGRIDRIGSTNDVIQLVNYWPDIELDDYIQLKGRVESRMKATVLTSTGDDDLLSATEKGDLEYRRNQLKKLQQEVVDIEDMDSGINIMDLGLNEFRLDLLAYVKDHPNMDLTPFGMSAVVESSDIAKPGVIFILKNKNNGVNIDRSNLLHPFYMVYLSNDGEVLCDHLSPKKLLDIMRHVCRGKNTPNLELCKVFNKETRDGRKMDFYSNLLHKAIESIIDVKSESDIDSLFSSGDTTALEGDVTGLDDFELITFLVIK